MNVCVLITNILVGKSNTIEVGPIKKFIEHCILLGCKSLSTYCFSCIKQLLEYIKLYLVWYQIGSYFVSCIGDEENREKLWKICFVFQIYTIPIANWS